MKRECVVQPEEGWWKVLGNTTLGDSYADYLVHCRSEADVAPEHADYHCSCQGTTGGEFRPVCSHKTRVVLKRQEDGGNWPWEEGGAKLEEEREQEGEQEGAEDEDEYEVDENLKAILYGKPATGSVDFSDKTPTEVVDDLANSLMKEVVDGLKEELEQEPNDLLHVEGTKDFFRVSNPAYMTEGWYPHPDQKILPSQLRLNDAEPVIPAQFSEYRDPQWQAICEIDQAFQDGYKVVMVSAPTGAGKTLIAESARRLLGTRGIYTCTTKVLQDQILRDFEDYAHVVKGRSNYTPLDEINGLGFRSPEQITTADCDLGKASLPACAKCPGYTAGQSWGGGGGVEARHCSHCHPWSECPYQVALRDAARSRLAVLNTALFLAETNYKSNSLFRGWPIVLMDEADKLEEELMRFIEVNISARMRKYLGITLPKHKTVDEEWAVWLSEIVIPALNKKIVSLINQRELTLDGLGDVKKKRMLKQLEQLQSALGSVSTYEIDEETGEEIPSIAQGWVYTGSEGKDADPEKVTITFKPVMVRDYAQNYLWSKGAKFVLLSATLISGEQMAYDLGLEDDEWTVVEVESSFPIERRPIIPIGTVDVTAKNTDEAYPVLVRQTADILDQHPDERILVHTVSYKLTKELYYNLRKEPRFRDRLYTYFNAGEREDALERYLADPRGVLFAPSFDRGVDLHGDDCSVIVVTKMPFLYLGDAQVKTRAYATGYRGKTWYAMQTIRTLCQMTGRGMRSKDDQCVTYILDNKFVGLYKGNKKLFPNWWSDAIVWSGNDPKWREPLNDLGAIRP